MQKKRYMKQKDIRKKNDGSTVPRNNKCEKTDSRKNNKEKKKRLRKGTIRKIGEKTG